MITRKTGLLAADSIQAEHYLTTPPTTQDARGILINTMAQGNRHRMGMPARPNPIFPTFILRGWIGARNQQRAAECEWRLGLISQRSGDGFGIGVIAVVPATTTSCVLKEIKLIGVHLYHSREWYVERRVRQQRACSTSDPTA